MAIPAFAWVLDADEHGFFIAAPRQAGDFTFIGADHEAVDIACGRIADQHLIVAHTREVTLVRILTIGLNPQKTVAVELQTIG